MMNPKRLEDYLTTLDINDKAVVLATASFLGGQAILRNQHRAGERQAIKSDGSTVGILDETSGKTMVRYVNNNLKAAAIKFRSEEKMPFEEPSSWQYAGLFDDLDGSINPMVGGVNLNFVGVSGVIHTRQDDQQIMAAGYLPFANPRIVVVAEKTRGTYAVTLPQTSKDQYSHKKVVLPPNPAQRNILLESGWMTPDSLDAELSLIQAGFYNEIGVTTKDRVCGGVFQTISGLLDNRQVVLNYAASHPADYLWLMLEEAGADVISQQGTSMHSLSHAMLSIAPSFTGDRERLKETFVQAMRSETVKTNYGGHDRQKVILEKLGKD
ncbi:hypothetical protein J4210_03410 [Candidatus Woesearchaeota archaeon]|nr:hypothetical protein [Candidatus Woesearchaeota archaeon]